ncbi:MULTISPECIES: SdiA-regulated domain-containing protein [unclassified Flavobacterium]|uniref:SdiA-regulated domain-containing protein n=1 Tax=unclassified Flavobacterium TaxID=196869 RepID=UPI001F139D31|nr:MULTISPECIES: SdiA-regulated domain-containing protein [unclassified Flavobacterium]UMY65506.1 SdiA-regulated domain-containing protein [Flavobacterium sp. HJ-32-4]
MRTFLLASCLLSTGIAGAQKTRLVPTQHYDLSIPEPSDICVAPDGVYYIVSDQGFLFETQADGTIIRKADYRGMDDEAVFADDRFVYVVEESLRKLRLFDRATLTLQRTVTLPYAGGRNKGYESLTYNPTTQKFLLITEKDPTVVFEVDRDFKVTNETTLKLARDISAATFHDGFVWVLSDEDRTVFKLDPVTYRPLAQWVLPVLNPEGLTFSTDNTLRILSDDRRRLYVFDLPLAP